MSSFRRGPLAFLIRLMLFVLLSVAAGEVWFRTVTPACQVPLYSQDTQWKIWRFDPQGPTEGTWTVGRLAERAGSWRVNNDGWSSLVDYLPAEERDRPLVALFGDSYIQAFDSDPEQHVDVYLADALSTRVDVYSFALGGFCLEQYVALGRYVSAEYAPDVLVLFVGANDVEDSMREYGVLSPYLWQIEASGTGYVEVPPTGIYSASRFARPARRSALFNYLHYNADLPLPGMRAAAIPSPAVDGAAGGASGEGADASIDARSWEELLPAARHMVGRLRAENPGVPIVFAWQGEHYLTEQELLTTPLYFDGRAIEAACEGSADCYFLDLRRVFSRDWASNHQRFEAADGIHWTAYTNRLVAGAVASLLEDKGLLAGPVKATP